MMSALDKLAILAFMALTAAGGCWIEARITKLEQTVNRLAGAQLTTLHIIDQRLTDLETTR